ncbi:peptide ABC transporter substrate-binding protein [Saccharospirillum sp. MSK14-1]|uniref:ABC transporter substrate-binding protein n=1 Tax=Saccharospirillum sp. MSK14-1 TaxID=1897632 RepID=UPI000D3912EA|nr:ABC transporter substrate-binding protein [Saccharospirillum sp. MSK14-1]PTY38064.1 peptide ABC transporter substrate-binding protein [Saccharospirillum sp. MSK14-1]
MKKGIPILVVVIAILAAAVWWFSSSDDQQVAEATTFVYCSEASPEGFNPAFYTSGTTFDAAGRTMFNRLVEFERGGTNVVPGLAESWEISDDGLTYTFHLREGVEFHTNHGFEPSRDFNAEDVLWSFNRQMDESHPYHGVSNQDYSYFGYMGMADAIESLTAPDDMTVVFELSAPNAPFLANLAMDFASIGSAEYADAMLEAGTPEQVDQLPIATGPFMLTDYQQDAVIRYTANPTYWEGAADIDRLVFSITPDASVRYAKLRSGECHHMVYPNPADIAEMQDDENINVMSAPGLNVGYLAFNTEKPPFDNKLVRQALNMATNKESILEAVYQGAGETAKNPIPPTMWSYNDDVVDYEYDPEGARELLAEAGYPNGFSTDIWAMPVQRPYNPNARRMAELIQSDWAAVGVDAEIVSYEWGEYLDRTSDGDHQTAMLGWTGDNGDPDNFLNTLLGCQAAATGGNIAFWCNDEFNTLVNDALRVSDSEQRTALYEQAQLVFKEEAPWITVAHSVVYEPMSPAVQGYKMSPFGVHTFYGVSLAESE